MQPRMSPPRLRALNLPALGMLFLVAANCAAAIEVNVVMPLTTQGGDGWLCTSIQLLAEDGELHMASVRPKLSQQLVDKLAVYSCAGPATSDPVWACATEESVCEPAETGTVMYEWDVEDATQDPVHTEIVIGGSTHPRFLVGRMHYKAARPDNDQSGFTLVMQPATTVEDGTLQSAAVVEQGQDENAEGEEDDQSWDDKEEELEQEEEEEEEELREEEEEERQWEELAREEEEEEERQWEEADEQEREWVEEQDAEEDSWEEEEKEWEEELEAEVEEEEEVQHQLAAESKEEQSQPVDQAAQTAARASQGASQSAQTAASAALQPALDAQAPVDTSATSFSSKLHITPQVGAIVLCAVAVAGCATVLAVFMVSRQAQAPHPDNTSGFRPLKQQQDVPRISISGAHAHGIMVDVDLEGGHQPGSLVWNKRA